MWAYLFNNGINKRFALYHVKNESNSNDKRKIIYNFAV